MSKYERLIIYPLLFLALFSALTGVNIVSATQQVWDRIVAREVVIVNDEGQEVAVLKYDQEKENPSLELFNNAGHRVIALAYADGGRASSTRTATSPRRSKTENAGALLIYNGTREMKNWWACGLDSRRAWWRSTTPRPAQGIMGNNANNGYIGLFKGELGFLHPQIMLKGRWTHHPNGEIISSHGNPWSSYQGRFTATLLAMRARAEHSPLRRPQPSSRMGQEQEIDQNWE